MKRLETYFQHLVRADSLDLILASEQVPRVRTTNGDRLGPQPIPHAHLVGMVDEIAPRAAILEINDGRPGSFVHGFNGVDFEVSVYPEDVGWRVYVRRAARISVAHIPAPPLVPTTQLRAVRSPIPPAANALGSSPPALASSPALAAVSPASRLPPVPVESPTASVRHATPGPPHRTSHPPATPYPSSPSTPSSQSGASLRATRSARLEHWLRAMVTAGADDLHLLPDHPPRMRLGDSLVTLDAGEGPLDASELRTALLAIVPTGVREELFRRDDVSFLFALDAGGSFRVHLYVDRRGLAASFRRLRNEVPPPDALGLPEDLVGLTDGGHGLVLVVGSEGPLVLASLVRRAAAVRGCRIVCLDDPLEFTHDCGDGMIVQRAVPDHVSSLRSGLRAMRSDDAEIFAVSMLRDPDSILGTLELADTGRLVLAVVPGASVVDGLARCLAPFGADRVTYARVLLSGVLRAAVAPLRVPSVSGGILLAVEQLSPSDDARAALAEGRLDQVARLVDAGPAAGMRSLEDGLAELVEDGRLDRSVALTHAARPSLLASRIGA